MSTGILLSFQTQLPSSEGRSTQWVYSDMAIHNKHTQYASIPVNEPKIPDQIVQTSKPIKPVKPAKSIGAAKPVNTVKEETHTQDMPSSIQTLYFENKEQGVTDNKLDNQRTRSRSAVVKKTKQEVYNPLELICKETGVMQYSYEYVKAKLIDTISQNEYIKVFGAKKSAEIMSGIMNNKWNKSVALFVSFLFNKTVLYNNAEVVYNIEKNNGTISLTKST